MARVKLPDLEQRTGTGSLIAVTGTVRVVSADDLTSPITVYSARTGGTTTSGTATIDGGQVIGWVDEGSDTALYVTPTGQSEQGPFYWAAPALTVRTGTGLIANGDAFRFDSTRLGTLKAAIANRNSAPVRILAMGDSRTEGEASTMANRWTNKLVGLLRSAYPVTGSPAGGVGFIPPLFVSANTLTTPFAYTGTKAAVSGSLGGGVAVSTGRSYQMSAGATATLPFTGTGVDIYYTKGSTGGNFTWAVDGGAATTVNSNAATTSGDGVVQIRGLTSGSHTLVITNVTSNTFFNGVVIYDGDEAKGFNMFEAGHSGATTADAIQTNSSAYDMHRLVVPHLVILDFTTNDWLIGNAPTSRIGPRQVGENLRDLIAAVRSADTDPSIILVEPTKRGLINTTVAVKGPWSEFTQAIRRVASEDGRITLFDQQTALGDFSTGTNPNAFTDQVHFSAAGNTANATALSTLIQSA